MRKERSGKWGGKEEIGWVWWAGLIEEMKGWLGERKWKEMKGKEEEGEDGES